MSIDNVGTRIKELRKKRGYTLKEISNLAKISISFLSDIENGRSKPSLERLTDIANALDTTTSYLLGENVTEKNQEPTENELDTLAEEFLDMLIRRGKIKTKEDLTPQNLLKLLNEIFEEIDNQQL